MVFSHDDRRLASASDDETVRLWDAETGALQQTLEGHTGWVRSCAFSHDDRRLASGSADKTVRIWDTETGALQQTLEGHTDSVYSVVFSHDDRRLASGSGDETVTDLGYRDGCPTADARGPYGLGLGQWPSHTTTGGWRLVLATTPYGSGMPRRVLYSRRSRAIRTRSTQWSSRTTTGGWRLVLATRPYGSGIPRRVLYSRRSRAIRAGSGRATFSHNGQRLASGSADKTVRLWDTETGALQQTLEGHTNWVHSVAFSHDDRRLASASSDKTVRIWDTETGAQQRTLEGHTD